MANLEDIACVQSDDDVKRDLELTCTSCGEHLCDVEPDDSLGTLVRVALEHACLKNRRPLRTKV